MENKEINVSVAEKDQQSFVIDWNDPEVLDVIKQTCAPGTTTGEFKAFILFCLSTGLNPLKKEIWCIVTTDKQGRRRLQQMTGINGFYELANRQSQFDGLEHGFVGPNGSYESLAYPKNDFIGAWTAVYRKDRKMPQREVAMLSEYNKNIGTWNSLRRVMIVKCSDALALRKSFPQQLGGLYAEEEMPQEYSLKAPSNGNGHHETQPVESQALDPVDTGNGSTAIYKYQFAKGHPDFPKLLNIARTHKMANGGKFNGDSMCWEFPVRCGDLAEFELGAPPAPDVDPLQGDDLPDWSNAPADTDIAELEGDAVQAKWD